MSDAKAVSAGGTATMVVKMDTSLWGSGNNNYGQLGHDTAFLTSKFIKV